MRVHELAKELGLNSKDLLARLTAIGLADRNHMSALSPDELTQIRQALAAKDTGKTPSAPSKPQVAPPPAKPHAPAASQPSAPTAATPAATPASAPTPTPPPAPAPEAKAASHTITLKGPIVVKELATIMGVRPNQLIAELMRMNVLASINESIEIKDAARVAEKHGFVVEREKKPEFKPLPKPPPPAEEKAKKEKAAEIIVRPPVVTFLGHVDHGKTSLLDRIRNTAVAKGESGGITQHIGAYTVKAGANSITFLDTPGHQAFTAMRARGANMTDIAVIIIDAADGIMPQTREAIKHAQAANVPIMVAINKIDLPTANPDKVKQQLAAMELTPEDWGGKVICCPVSALTGQGIKEFLDMILLQAEVLELKAHPGKPARGFVIESQLEAGMGPTANVLVTDGTLRVGDAVLCGPHWGRIRALISDHGVKLKEAGPATPVKCLGLSGVPDAGASFEVYASDKVARATAALRAAEAKAVQLTPPKRASLENLFEKIKESEKLELKLVIKGDVQGSIEAIEHSLKDIRSDKVTISIIMSGVGTISANDILLASASDAVVLGFHVAVDENASRIAKQEGVEVRLHSIIYELIDQVQEAMVGLLPAITKEKIHGHALVKQVFTISKGGVVAGCMLTDGHATPRLKVRVKRKTDVLFEGSVSSLRRFQNDVSEVKESQECGIRLDNYSAFAEGDVLEFYDVERIPQTL